MHLVASRLVLETHEIRAFVAIVEFTRKRGESGVFVSDGELRLVPPVAERVVHVDLVERFVVCTSLGLWLVAIRIGTLGRERRVALFRFGIATGVPVHATRLVVTGLVLARIEAAITSVVVTCFGVVASRKGIVTDSISDEGGVVAGKVTIRQVGTVQLGGVLVLVVFSVFLVPNNTAVKGGTKVVFRL